MHSLNACLDGVVMKQFSKVHLRALMWNWSTEFITTLHSFFRAAALCMGCGSPHLQPHEAEA